MMKILEIVVTCIFLALLFFSPAKATECIGNCVRIRQCPALKSILEKVQSKRGSPGDIALLRKAVCANDDSGLRVCCPPPKPELNRKCGLSFNDDRIVNGEDAKLGQWPWMVIFRARECRNCEGTCKNCSSDLGPSNWICGGVLITEQYVLTAAHCFTNTQIEYARIGEFDLSNETDRERGYTAPLPQDIDVEKVIKHQEHKSPCLRCNDIALVKLARPAQMHDPFVTSICVPVYPLSDIGFAASAFQSRVAMATGWGVTDASNVYETRGSDILQQVNLTIQDSSSFCLQQKEQFPEGSIMCAGQGDGKGTCRADSGGPLMLRDSSGTKWYVVGITSFGPTACGTKDIQGIFTSVHYHVDWIKQNLL